MSGQTFGQIAAAAVATPGQRVVVPVSKPIKPTAAIANAIRLSFKRILMS